MVSFYDRRILLAFILTESSIAFYLYFASSSLILAFKMTPFGPFPDPAGNILLSFLYALVPSFIGLYSTFLIAEWTEEA